MPFRSPKRRSATWGMFIAAIICCAFIAGSVFGYFLKTAQATSIGPHSSTPIDGGFLAVSGNGVAYLQITTLTTPIFGYSLQVSEQDAYANTGAVATGWSCLQSMMSYPNYGNMAGNQVILNGSPWFFNGNPSGLYDGNSITFTLPDASGALAPVSFQRASIDQYNNAMNNVKAICAPYGK